MRSPAERFDQPRWRLDMVRRELEEALSALYVSWWTEPPRPGRWSVVQVLEHLRLVEAKVVDWMARRFAAGPLPRPDWRRFFHLPVSWVESRILRVKTFRPFEPQTALSPEEVVADLRRVRRRLLTLLDAHREHDLRGLCARHLLLGYLDGYAWMAFLAAHERRHLKQIAEIVAGFRSSGTRASV